MTINAPCVNFVLMPPAALVSIKRADAKPPQHAHGKRHRLQVVPLVEVHTTRKRQHAPADDRAADESSGVADDA